MPIPYFGKLAGYAILAGAAYLAWRHLGGGTGIGTRIGMGIGDASIGLGRGVLAGFQGSLDTHGVSEALQNVFRPLTGGFVPNSPTGRSPRGTSADRRAAAYYDTTQVRPVMSITTRGGQTVDIPGGYLSREAIQVYRDSGVRINYG